MNFFPFCKGNGHNVISYWRSGPKRNRNFIGLLVAYKLAEQKT